MTAIRSHFTPERVRDQEGRHVVHLAHHQRRAALDATHGFTIPSYNIHVSIEPGETRFVRVSRADDGVFSYYCTEFCSALHLEMMGYMLVPQIARPRRFVSTVAPGDPGPARARRPRGRCGVPGRRPPPRTPAPAPGRHLVGPRRSRARRTQRDVIIDVTGAGAAVLGLTVDGREWPVRQARQRGPARCRRHPRRGRDRGQHHVRHRGREGASRSESSATASTAAATLPTACAATPSAVWETRDSLIEAQPRSTDGRDLVVWYSRGNTLRGNLVDGGRYGLHFMYSSRQRRAPATSWCATGGRHLRHVQPRPAARPTTSSPTPAARPGWRSGSRTPATSTVTGNRLVHNTLGIYIDSSPMQRGDRVDHHRQHDAPQRGRAGVPLERARPDRARSNDLADNGVQVRVDGGGDATHGRLACATTSTTTPGTTSTVTPSATCRTSCARCQQRADGAHARTRPPARHPGAWPWSTPQRPPRPAVPAQAAILSDRRRVSMRAGRSARGGPDEDRARAP
jgi:hypothetical protein